MFSPSQDVVLLVNCWRWTVSDNYVECKILKGLQLIRRYTHTHTHTHTHTRTHTHTAHAHIRTHKQTQCVCTCSTHAHAHTDIHTHMHTLLLCSYHLMYIHIVSIQNNFSNNRLANGSSIMPAIIGTTIYKIIMQNLCAVIVNDEALIFL